MAREKRTKWDILRDIMIKAGKAKLDAQRVFLKGLEYKTKAQLESVYKRMHVTSEGDIRPKRYKR